MRRVVTILGMAIASVPAALIMLVFFMIVEVAHAYRRSTAAISGRRVTRAQQERFNNELQELEFRVMNTGPTIIARGAP